ncbi:hypothetical protein NQ176_g3088 [Zarea fungicola]|uniref:Uncharacterized protein n=1 Tax=Zarea fungicola TaxID=93591 RepID=A0ACC1NLH5_9HYPO|nr:hypothetical protein NQ176_g3088 [Lecanicillium fungicola]
MVRLSTLVLPLVASLSSFCAASSLSLPDNPPEGLGFHLKDEAGNIVYVHHTELAAYGLTLGSNTTSQAGSVDNGARGLTERGNLPKGDSLNCDWKTSFNLDDLRLALVRFSEQLGCNGNTVNLSGNAPYQWVALNYVYGSAVIYICNYGGQSRTFEAAPLLGFLEQVYQNCQTYNVGGWYSESFYDVAWGYTQSQGKGYCGPPK